MSVFAETWLATRCKITTKCAWKWSAVNPLIQENPTGTHRWSRLQYTAHVNRYPSLKNEYVTSVTAPWWARPVLDPKFTNLLCTMLIRTRTKWFANRLPFNHECTGDSDMYPAVPNIVRKYALIPIWLFKLRQLIKKRRFVATYKEGSLIEDQLSGNCRQIPGIVTPISCNHRRRK